MYQHAVSFLSTDKVNSDFPMSEKFLSNMIAIFNNKHVIHHSHVTGRAVGYNHDFCIERAKENYCTIPVFAHNQFRFDFFLFLKGIRPSVWETAGIDIGGKNLTDINFAIIRNQQSLESLSNSMTDVKREKVKKICRRFLCEKLMFLSEKMKSGC